MGHADNPEGWQNYDRKPAAAPPPPRKVTVFVRIVRFTLFLVFVTAGVAGYLYLGQHTRLGETLPMPRALQSISDAHDDAIRYGRSLQEAAADASRRFRTPGPQLRPAARRMNERLDALREDIRPFESRLTRQEDAALVELFAADKELRSFIESSLHAASGFDPTEIDDVRDHIEDGLVMLQGKSPANVQKRKRRLGRVGEAARAIEDVQGAAGKLRLGAEP